MRRSYFTLFFLALLLMVFITQGVPCLAAEDALNGPWETPAESSVAKGQRAGHREFSVATGVFTYLLTFFQEAISPVDGDRCPSYPTCAAYSRQAYQKHGALLGTLMTVDRLIHEASESRFSPMVEVHGVRRIYDPVSANEFWTEGRRRQAVKTRE